MEHKSSHFYFNFYINNDIASTILVASQQQHHFDIQLFQGMYTQQNTQQSELQKDPDNEDQEGAQEYDRESDEDEIREIFVKYLA